MFHRSELKPSKNCFLIREKEFYYHKPFDPVCFVNRPSILNTTIISYLFFLVSALNSDSICMYIYYHTLNYISVFSNNNNDKVMFNYC